MSQSTNNSNPFLEKGINPLTSTYQNIWHASSKKVTVKLTPDCLSQLKENGYKLCFAKKVGNFDYNVVWQSYDRYLENNSFSWVPQYSVFGSNSFRNGAAVEISCNPVQIGLGETATLNKSGIFNPAVTGGSVTAITIDNEYGSIHLGVNQLSVGLSGDQISTPIFVTEKTAITGTIELTPVERFLVWFQQNIETGTMFSMVPSSAIEVDLTYSDDVSVLYDGHWKVI